ncbi:hypothetical protein Tco_0803926 [Tanacetum coccineum]|uniref:MAK10-like protein n=1 Tax=Tanacetum coccineum TaxID=301880 RepID=A0ABQ5A4M2_9ASTR
MENENPIRTLEDTIELSDGNNVVPLRSDTIRLVQNGCSFHGLWSEDPNQHLKDFLKLVDSLDLDVDSLMKDAILLIGKSENLCGISSNDFGRFPPEPSHQEAFEGLLMNFILDQEEKVHQLEEHISVIRSDFMQLSLEVVKKLKEEIKIKENSSKRIQKITRRSIHSESVIDWAFLATHGLARNFFDSINTDTFFGPQWVNLFQVNELVYRELVWEFFASIEFDYVSCRYDPEHLGVSFRLGGESRMLSLLEFGWRVGLYSEEQSRLISTKSGLRKGETVKAQRVLMEFWPTIGDAKFVVGGMVVKKVRDLRVRLAHHCIATTILGRKESTQRITAIDLFYLYCIYGEGIATSFGLLTGEMIDALSVEPRAHIFKKKSLTAIGILMELDGGACYWPTTSQVGEDDEVEEKANEGAGGSSEMYRNMSRGDWQYLSTHDNLDPHLHIDPFPEGKADYPPYGYTGHTPPGYDYRYGPALDGSN